MDNERVKLLVGVVTSVVPNWKHNLRGVNISPKNMRATYRGQAIFSTGQVFISVRPDITQVEEDQVVLHELTHLAIGVTPGAQPPGIRKSYAHGFPFRMALMRAASAHFDIPFLDITGHMYSVDDRIINAATLWPRF